MSFSQVAMHEDLNIWWRTWCSGVHIQWTWLDRDEEHSHVFKFYHILKKFRGSPRMQRKKVWLSTHAKSFQSCLSLCDTMGCVPPGSSDHRILQRGVLEGGAMPISRGSSWPRDRTQGSCIAGRFFFYHWATGEHKKEYYNRSAQWWNIFLCEILSFHSWKTL